MSDSAMLPAEVKGATRRYLALADRLLPERLAGLYVVGSVAFGAYRPGRSDIDFIAVLERDLGPADLRRLRVLHAVAGARGGMVAMAHRRQPLTGTMNGAFVCSADLTKPVTEIVPVASHTGHHFRVGQAFDVNPVMWAELAERGIAVRGAAPTTLGLDPQPRLLRQWNVDNLHGYWEAWARQTQTGGDRLGWRIRPRWMTAWGVLGPPRLHYTIATGRLISKEAAGQYALETFGPEWHLLIQEALAARRGEPVDPAFGDLAVRSQQVAEFVLEVVRGADAL